MSLLNDFFINQGIIKEGLITFSKKADFTKKKKKTKTKTKHYQDTKRSFKNPLKIMSVEFENI